MYNYTSVDQVAELQKENELPIGKNLELKRDNKAFTFILYQLGLMK